MKIVMMTNTYRPHVGGVARSVESFAEALRAERQQVLVVAPTFENMPAREPHVLRFPAIQRFNGSDFSVRLPMPGFLTAALDRFRPDVLHAHHPFLLGDTALRSASWRNLPLVFTHHTMYEQYTHYVPGDSPAMRSVAIRLATDFANLCNHVVAPSESIAEILAGRGVEVPITAIPTGIDPQRFAGGDGAAARAAHEIPEDAFVVGHVGRLAPEKNLEFLAGAVAAFLADRPSARFLVVGSGPSADGIRRVVDGRGLGDRLVLTGSLQGTALRDAYHAMDVFAFASRSETQGMVLAEAMTCGVPVVAVDAPGVREVVRDGRNGVLLPDRDDAAAFARALATIADRPERERQDMAAELAATAEAFSLGRCTKRLLQVYETVVAARPRRPPVEESGWTQTLRLLEAEWNLWSARAEAVVRSVGERRR
jgi:glycosyltransferase involved in cell wall biosynthesis